MRNEQGEPFDWGDVIGEILQIRSQSSRPDDAIEYRGSWFYVDDSDLGSKSTMTLLSQLFAL